MTKEGPFDWDWRDTSKTSGWQRQHRRLCRWRIGEPSASSRLPLPPITRVNTITRGQGRCTYRNSGGDWRRNRGSAGSWTISGCPHRPRPLLLPRPLRALAPRPRVHPRELRPGRQNRRRRHPNHRRGSPCRVTRRAWMTPGILPIATTRRATQRFSVFLLISHFFSTDRRRSDKFHIFDDANKGRMGARSYRFTQRAGRTYADT